MNNAVGTQNACACVIIIDNNINIIDIILYLTVSCLVLPNVTEGTYEHRRLLCSLKSHSLVKNRRQHLRHNQLRTIYNRNHSGTGSCQLAPPTSTASLRERNIDHTQWAFRAPVDGV